MIEPKIYWPEIGLVRVSSLLGRNEIDDPWVAEWYEQCSVCGKLFTELPYVWWTLAGEDLFFHHECERIWLRKN